MQDLNDGVIARIEKGETHVKSSKGLVLAVSKSADEQPTSAGEMLAMSLATCLNATLKVVLAAHQKDIYYVIEVKQTSHREDNRHDGYYFDYEVHITLHDISEALGEKYVALTKKLCPISKILSSYDHYHTIIHYK